MSKAKRPSSTNPLGSIGDANRRSTSPSVGMRQAAIAKLNETARSNRMGAISNSGLTLTRVTELQR